MKLTAGHVIQFAKKYAASGQLIDLTGKKFTVSTLDLVYFIKKEPMRLGEALKTICRDDFRKWMVRPVGVVKRYDYSELPEAVSALAQDGHCSMAYILPSETTPVPILPLRNHLVGDYLQSDGTYVLAGQGGLGMHIAKMLESNGVKNIALLSRSGASSEASRATVTFLQNRRVKVQVLKVDICDKPALQLAIEMIQQTMPRIRGLFQCAATIRDAVFDNMTYEDWQAAVRPKTVGSWNLYKLFPRDLDFFVFLSSAAGVIGNRGQANYAVGNAFQDALARHINTQGSMRSVSIDLGPVLGAGMLAEDPSTLDKLKASGFIGVRLQDFERVVERAITGYTNGNERIPHQVVIGVGTGGLIRQNKPADPYWTRTALFTHLNKVDMPPDAEGSLAGTDNIEQGVKSLLAQAQSAEEATEIVTTGLRHLLAGSMNMKPGDVDDGKPPNAYGVDSLVAVGVRGWVFRECGADVSVFQVLSDASISELSAEIVEKGGFGC
jgi:NADP-dependent 3-hydroxy acid dehydrogenase YdfG